MKIDGSHGSTICSIPWLLQIMCRLFIVIFLVFTSCVLAEAKPQDSGEFIPHLYMPDAVPEAHGALFRWKTTVSHEALSFLAEGREMVAAAEACMCLPDDVSYCLCGHYSQYSFDVLCFCNQCYAAQGTMPTFTQRILTESPLFAYHLTNIETYAPSDAIRAFLQLEREKMMTAEALKNAVDYDNISKIIIGGSEISESDAAYISFVLREIIHANLYAVYTEPTYDMLYNSYKILGIGLIDTHGKEVHFELLYPGNILYFFRDYQYFPLYIPLDIRINHIVRKYRHRWAAERGYTHCCPGYRP